jgi:ferrous iron transport protein A
MSNEYPLSMAPEGKPLRVISIRAGRELSKRLQELGLNEESIISVVGRQPSGPLILQVNHSRFALGRGMAMRIMVAEAD